MRICKVEDCSTDLYAREFCKLHYRRFRAHGDPLIVKRGGTYRGRGPAGNNWKGRNINYRSAHMRTQRMRGKADLYLCECGQRAKDWAYDYTDPDPLTGLNGKYVMTYSPDVERYTPMCRACHKVFDKEHDGEPSRIRALA
jgi:hypothetical protein